MAEILSQNRDAYRGAILYEAKAGTPVGEAYRKMKLVMEDPDLNYVDFEYTYYKLLEDPKNHGRELEDRRNYCGLITLPIEVVDRTVKGLSLTERLRFRKTSPCIRDALDVVNVRYQGLGIFTKEHSVTINFNEHKVDYHRVGKGCGVAYKLKYLQFDNDDFVSMAIRDMKALLRNPKLYTDNFFIHLDKGPVDMAKKIIKAMKETYDDLKGIGFNAREVNMKVENTDQYLSIIKLFQKKDVETLNVYYFPKDRSTLDLTYLNQWPGLKRIYIRSEDNCILNCLEVFGKLQYFQLQCLLGAEEVFQIINILSNSDHFQQCFLTLSCLDFDEIGRRIGVPAFGILGGVHHFWLATGRNHFQIEADIFGINLIRVSEDMIRVSQDMVRVAADDMVR